ncbi:hypothetical protein A5881_003627 [Enterococcus termitis]
MGRSIMNELGQIENQKSYISEVILSTTFSTSNLTSLINFCNKYEIKYSIIQDEKVNKKILLISDQIEISMIK